MNLFIIICFEIQGDVGLPGRPGKDGESGKIGEIGKLKLELNNHSNKNFKKLCI